MTQLVKDPEAISNYFDRLTRGIGDRGSSFTDIDAMTHDWPRHRFLFQEFKQPGETLSNAQLQAYCDLAQRAPTFTVWLLRRREDGLLDFADCADYPRTKRVITEADYQRLFEAWWKDPATVCVGCRMRKLFPGSEE